MRAASSEGCGIIRFNTFLVGLGIGLVSCGSGPDDSPTPGAEVSAGETLRILHPFDGTILPPDIAPVKFVWEDSSGADQWRLEFTGDGQSSLRFEVSLPRWRAPNEDWERIKRLGQDREGSLTIVGRRRAAPDVLLSRARLGFSVSPDEVGAPLFYREVILPFIQAVQDPSRIRWRFGGIDSLQTPPVVMENLPVCGNCHSFPRDGQTLAMDVDYANSKGSYVLTAVGKNMKLRSEDVISWDDFRRGEGAQTFGLLSQISPDGGTVVSTVKDRSVFVARPDLEYSQLFFPIQGILAVYHRSEKTFHALPGADDPRYVQSNPGWSPDGETIVFARSEAYQLRGASEGGGVLLRPEECKEFLEEGREFQFDLYRVPFNGGAGGKATPLAGASHNGRSNFFPRYSPDGKWIVFCQADNYMLLQPDSELYILPAEGGEPRRLVANTGRMNSWHSWSPNGRWLVFASKAFSPYTQLFLTHIDEEGRSSPAICLDYMTASDRAANIPEFVNAPPRAIVRIEPQFLNDYSFARAGYVSEQTGDVDRAVARYRKALELNPENPHAQERLGYLLYFEKQDQATGLGHIQRAVALAPENGQAQFFCGQALLQEGDLGGAVRHLNRALELVAYAPATDARYDRGNVLHILGLALGLGGDFAGGADRLREAVKEKPSNAMIRFSYANILARQGQIDEPWRELRQAVAQDAALDRLPLVYALLAESCVRAGRTNEAKELAGLALQRAEAVDATQDIAAMRRLLRSLSEPLAADE